MIRYERHYITFQEVPNEVSLVITVTGCPRRCEGCHSPWLQDRERGDDLKEALPVLLDQYGDAVTCVCFMGEGTDEDSFEQCVHMVWMRKLKVCLYSGVDSFEDLPYIARYLNYVKIGHYDKRLGGLDVPGTNQRFYWNPNALYSLNRPYCYEYCWKDMTEEFQKKTHRLE